MCPILRNMTCVIKGLEGSRTNNCYSGWGSSRKTRGLRGSRTRSTWSPESRVVYAASAGNESISTSKDVSTRVYSYFMNQMSEEDVGVTSTSLFSSRRTLARRRNSVISTRNKRDVWNCLTLMTNSWSIINPKFSRFLAMIDTIYAAFEWRRIDLFYYGMILLLMNPN